MTRAVAITLPYPLSANRYWKAIRIPGRTMMAPSKEAKAYKADVAQLVSAAGITEPIAGRVRVEIRLYPQRPADWLKRARSDPNGWDDGVRCIDLDNARKVLYDALRGLVIVDDRWIREDAAWRMVPDEHGARVELTVASLGESR